MPHEAQRRYIGSALSHAGPAILGDPRVRVVLGRLTQDSSEAVRNAVKWVGELRMAG